jgi:DNA invertase Pin-like site-specific DNA recombinase
MKDAKYVSYLRVSTARQGRSGLGMEAQREAVKNYLASSKGKLLTEYVEVESGKNNARTQLQKALHHAKVTGATLVVAKLDRLSRNAAFLMALRESGVGFVAADMPEANTMTVGIMALVAQNEREAISNRTVAALKAWKQRNPKLKLGNPNGAKALLRLKLGNSAAVAEIRARADEKARDVQPIIADIRASGITTLRGIAAELNERGVKTARKCDWHATTVANILARFD